MSFDNTKVTIGENNEAAAVVNINSPHDKFTITINAVNANNEFAAATAGTADLECMPSTSTQWESVYQADGTTPVSIDLTASNPTTIGVKDKVIQAFRTTPTGLTEKAVRLAVEQMR